jgi:hypothetical protein
MSMVPSVCLFPAQVAEALNEGLKLDVDDEVHEACRMLVGKL